MSFGTDRDSKTDQRAFSQGDVSVPAFREPGSPEYFYLYLYHAKYTSFSISKTFK